MYFLYVSPVSTILLALVIGMPLLLWTRSGKFGQDGLIGTSSLFLDLLMVLLMLLLVGLIVVVLMGLSL
ncbi:hypothetical protein CASFOL_013616 [Castilleja foliolosa]|uniref:Uncharacterized protein n=1 Tax=Castilleja foliolosa TaxID=1961234 RepID=A0ABD3DKI2_9LAMI